MIDDIERRRLYSEASYPDDDFHNRTIASAEYARNLLARVSRYESDAQPDARASVMECRTCFYLRPRGIQAGFERVNCRQCDKPMTVPSPVDREVCLECSQQHSLCTRCGGDIDGNERRRKLCRRGDGR